MCPVPVEQGNERRCLLKLTCTALLQVQEMYAAALAEDPSAFDYDGVYDSIQEEKLAPKMQDRAARQPKYIASLLEQAQLRKREQEITNERIMVSCRAWRHCLCVIRAPCRPCCGNSRHMQCIVRLCEAWLTSMQIRMHYGDVPAAVSTAAGLLSLW